MAENTQVRDIVVVGAGTAGLTAAIYGRRAGRDVLVLEEQTYGGQIVNTPDIENYPGIKHTSGFDFATGLYEQALELGAEVHTARATGVDVLGEGDEAAISGARLVVHADDGDVPCRALVIATGAKNRPLGVEREQEMVGRGVSYCATCDGMFFRGRDVVVVGGGNTALEDAAFLSNYCRRVYLVHRRDTFRGDARDVERLRERENVEFVLESRVRRLLGESLLEGVEVEGVNTGETRRIEAAGLFVAVGQVPDNAAFASVVDLDERGYVVADEGCTTRTPGVFAAGDCRTKQVRQLVTAAADGAVAALAASAGM